MHYSICMSLFYLAPFPLSLSLLLSLSLSQFLYWKKLYFMYKSNHHDSAIKVAEVVQLVWCKPHPPSSFNTLLVPLVRYVSVSAVSN